jgi:hypothetical protein
MYRALVYGVGSPTPPHMADRDIPIVLILPLRRAVAGGHVGGAGVGVDAVERAFLAMRDLMPACHAAVELASASLQEAPLDEIESHEVLGACIRAARPLVGMAESGEDLMSPIRAPGASNGPLG